MLSFFICIIVHCHKNWFPIIGQDEERKKTKKKKKKSKKNISPSSDEDEESGPNVFVSQSLDMPEGATLSDAGKDEQ